MPHCRGRGQAQAGAQPARSVGQTDRPGRRLLLHPGQQGQGRHLGRGHARHLPDQPQEVHPRH